MKGLSMSSIASNRRLSVRLSCVGLGIYLIVLELVRLLNYYCAELYAATPYVYGAGCLFSSFLITTSMIILIAGRGGIKIWIALILGVPFFFVIGGTLVYLAYFVPYLQHERFEWSDWLLVCIIFLVGILLVAWGAGYRVRG
jgi:hypothetical protein